MKINKSRLSPLYDQYSNDENRLTHALFHTIGSSGWIFSRFLKELVGLNNSLSGTHFEVSSQKVPFAHGDNDPQDVESIPDGWIIDEANSLGIVVEVKDRKNNLSLKQLRSHINRIKNYNTPYLLVITPDLQKPNKVIELERKEVKKIRVLWRSWDEIYRWLNKLSISRTSKNDKNNFLISSMLEYLERRKEVLGFQGITFPKGFNVNEAKFILNAEMEELEQTVKSLYKDLLKRRPAITTISQEAVWDCFGNDDGFTTDLHFTLGINEKSHDISITVPNSAKKAWSQLKKVFSDPDLEKELYLILKNLRKEVPHVFIEFIQRHFLYRKYGIRDGYMEFNIDTLGSPFRNKNSKVKEFPIWGPTLRDAVRNKKNVNAQVMFKSRFFLNETKDIDKPKFIKTTKATLKAFKPLYSFLQKNTCSNIQATGKELVSKLGISVEP